MHRWHIMGIWKPAGLQEIMCFLQKDVILIPPIKYSLHLRHKYRGTYNWIRISSLLGVISLVPTSKIQENLPSG